jgi:hypothetical protein
MNDKEWVFEQQLTYLKHWVDDLNRQRLLEIRRIVDDGLGMAEFREKLEEEGIKF